MYLEMIPIIVFGGIYLFIFGLIIYQAVDSLFLTTEYIECEIVDVNYKAGWGCRSGGFGPMYHIECKALDDKRIESCFYLDKSIFERRYPNSLEKGSRKMLPFAETRLTKFWSANKTKITVKAELQTA